MHFIIEAADDTSREASVIREQVFGIEWGLSLPRLTNYPAGQQLTLVARESRSGEPVAALTVVETTGDSALHRRLGLRFPDGARAARYTQLAVTAPWRGMDLPIRLILEARRQFVAPRRIGFTWLLFDAGRADSCSLCQQLGFRASSRTYLTEYGSSRVLTRDELASGVTATDARVAERLQKADAVFVPFDQRPPVAAAESISLLRSQI